MANKPINDTTGGTSPSGRSWWNRAKRTARNMAAGLGIGAAVLGGAASPAAAAVADSSSIVQDAGSKTPAKKSFARRAADYAGGVGKTASHLFSPLDSTGNSAEAISSAYVNDLDHACPGMGNALRIFTATLKGGMGTGIMGGFCSVWSTIRQNDTTNQNAAQARQAQAEATANAIAKQSAFSGIATSEALNDLGSNPRGGFRGLSDRLDGRF